MGAIDSCRGGVERRQPMVLIPHYGVEYLIHELKHRSPRAERKRRKPARAIAATLTRPLRARHAQRQGTETAGSGAAAAPPGAPSGAGMAR
jgi:hypothetical protein